MATPKASSEVAAYLAQLHQDPDKPGMLDPALAAMLPNIPGTLDLDVSSLTTPAPSPDFAIAKEAVAPVAVPAAVLSADLEQPAAPAHDALATMTGKRPLAHFGQVLPVTKSKANRKLVLQLTPEMYQYFAHVATLPGLDGIPLPDLAVAILHAWREDYRPEIKKANAAFKA